MPGEQAKWDEESAVFRAFMAAEPHFAGRAIKEWSHNGNDAPDIIATTSDGRKAGVELVEWLSEDWISNYARWLRMLDRLNVPNGWHVRLHIPYVLTQYFSTADEKDITAELVTLIQMHAPTKPAPKASSKSVCSFPLDIQVLSRETPRLSAYCDSFTFCNFGFRSSVDFAADRLTKDAETALRTAIEKKTNKLVYKRKKKELKLDPLVLLVHGSGSLTADHFASDDDIRVVAANAVKRDPGAFDIGFVMTYLNPWLGADVRSYRILP